MQIAVVIPVYNEAERLGDVLDKMPKTIWDYELYPIVVDDGSHDKTSHIANKFSRAKVLRHKINLGKGAAAKTGCDLAYKSGVDIVVLMDGDGQHCPTDIEKVIMPVHHGEADLVIGSRQMGGAMPTMMKVGNTVLTATAQLLFDIRIKDTQSGFRSFKREIYPSIRWAAANYSMETEMLILGARHRIKFAEVGIDTVYLDSYKGTTVIDGLRILKTLIKWRVLWLQASKSLESFSA